MTTAAVPSGKRRSAWVERAPTGTEEVCLERPGALASFDVTVPAQRLCALPDLPQEAGLAYVQKWREQARCLRLVLAPPPLAWHMSRFPPLSLVCSHCNVVLGGPFCAVTRGVRSGDAALA